MTEQDTQPDAAIETAAPQPWAEHPSVVALAKRFADIDLDPRDTLVHGQPIGLVTVTLPADRLIEVMTFLHDEPGQAYDLLNELTCVDYLKYPEVRPGRYGVTYGLTSIEHNRRLWAKVFVNDPDPSVPSVTGIWRGAGWLEREVFDMFGVVFDGHADLRRILTPTGFKYHPLRKDYPVTGRGERESFTPVERFDA